MARIFSNGLLRASNAERGVLSKLKMEFKLFRLFCAGKKDPFRVGNILFKLLIKVGGEVWTEPEL